MTYPSRGSEWRKWNFHVHTKGTNKNDQFKSRTMEDFFYVFFKMAFSNKVAGIGITDYFSIDRYRDAIKYIEEIESKKDNSTNEKLFTSDEVEFIKSIFLFPNVELRISPTTRRGKFINLHFLFNPKILDQVENEFFNKLKNVDNYLMNYDSICQYAKSLNSSLHQDQLYQYGIDHYNIEFGKVKELLETNKLIRDNSIVAISSKSNDGVSGLKDYYQEFENEGGSLLGTIKSIYKKSRIIFSNAPSDKSYFLGKSTSIEEVINHTGSLKPCVIGCDSHKEDTLFNRLTWVKAEPSFEGLKQITFEPEERVSIQEEIPESQKLDNLMIEKVTFTSSENRFTPRSIYFNKNLNVIIGGKSSGKSILLYEIARTLYSDTRADILRYIDTTDNKIKYLYDLKTVSNDKIDETYSFKVDLFSKSSQTNLDRKDQSSILPSIKYIPQNHLANLVDRSRKNGATLKKIIRNLVLEEPKYKSMYDDFVNQAKKHDKQRNHDIDFYYTLKDDLQKKEDDLRIKGDVKALKEGIKFNKDKMNKLHSGFTEKERDFYEELNEKFRLLKIKENQINSDFEKLNSFHRDLNQSLTTILHNKKIILDSLQVESIKSRYTNEFNFIDEALDKTNDLATDFNQGDNNFLEGTLFVMEMKKVQDEMESIISKLKPFNDKLENQKQAEALQKSIADDEAKIASILQFKREIEAIKKDIAEQRNKIFKDFAINFKLYERIINDLKPRIEEVQSKTDKIEIMPRIKYNYPKFRELVDKVFDRRGFNNKGFDYIYQYWDQNPKSALSDISYTNFEDALKRLFKRIDSNELLLKGGNTKNEAVKKIFTDFFFDHWDVNSEGDDIHKMSTGKASLVLLKLIIKLSIDNGPILIDQPEDNLDNRSVSKSLVDFLKEKKKDRQIILVTHNPNIVVNADAENIIVANQNGQGDFNDTSKYKFDYINGPLENTYPPNGNLNILHSMGIREHIADIVEGGKEAFKKREEKYGFKEIN